MQFTTPYKSCTVCTHVIAYLEHRYLLPRDHFPKSCTCTTPSTCTNPRLSLYLSLFRSPARKPVCTCITFNRKLLIMNDFLMHNYTVYTFFSFALCTSYTKHSTLYLLLFETLLAMNLCFPEGCLTKLVNPVGKCYFC